MAMRAPNRTAAPVQFSLSQIVIASNDPHRGNKARIGNETDARFALFDIFHNTHNRVSYEHRTVLSDEGPAQRAIIFFSDIDPERTTPRNRFAKDHPCRK